MKKSGLRIVADANMPLLEETFGRHGRLLLEDGRRLAARQVRDADVLLVRSVTRVRQELIAGSKVRFVGTATIGTDHLDIPWLESNGIRWASAPGCNATAAAQYALSMMMLACQRLDQDFFGRRIGIVGRGNVGSRLQALLCALGVESVACDPPLAERGEPDLVRLEEALDCNIVSLHVPLTREGRHATFQMIGPGQLAAMRDGSILVNTSRGDVIDEVALLGRLGLGRLHAALDVWRGEPEISPELVSATTVASPHVAGYSVEGRNNGTRAIYRQFLEWSGLESPGAAEPAVKKPAGRLMLRLAPSSPEQVVSSAVIQSTGVKRDNLALREAVSGTHGRPGFDTLRRDYPLRREFAGWAAVLPEGKASRQLHDLGFSLAPGPALV